ncbi:MAG: type II toxin-antitoxin system HicB family antitoxin [Bacillota bacterium]|nr:type II toxin-antitoxin system HicB family antitoxin [Bacillota bacterium]
MSSKNRYSFIAVFNYAEDGISISFPDLPDCLPCASTEDEAFKTAQEALGLHLWGMEQDGEGIPAPRPLKNIEVRNNEVAVMVEVFMPPVRERVNNRFVKKTLSLPAWLAAQAEKDNVNYSKLLQSALINYLGVDSPNSQNYKQG